MVGGGGYRDITTGVSAEVLGKVGGAASGKGVVCSSKTSDLRRTGYGVYFGDIP